MDLDRDACYRALQTRDPRFDGRFFTAVRTTGIYCRPICPARAPKLENVVFYRSALAAQQAGFRPCLRCRPESSPDLAAWQGPLYGRPPSALRRQRSDALAERVDAAAITLFLSYAPPYDWPAMIEFLGARAIPGVEVVEQDRYLRTVELDGRHGTIEVRPTRGRSTLTVTIRFPNVKALSAIVGRIRRVFDLGADVAVIDRQLAEDPTLAPLVTARPGLRLPGAWDGFELAIRAILGQQITVTAARQLAGKLVATYGEPLADDGSFVVPGLITVFPSPAVLAVADLASLGMPRARARSMSALAGAAAADPDLFARGPDLVTAIARLRALPGIGEWTAQYIAMRALREPDAFPAADIGLLRAMTGVDGVRPTPATLLARAEAWHPWRAYAAQHLWTLGGRISSSTSANRGERSRSTSAGTVDPMLRTTATMPSSHPSLDPDGQARRIQSHQGPIR